MKISCQVLVVISSGSRMRYNLSEVIEVIKDRRSIKPEAYTDRPVHREIIEGILNSAIWAPSHGMTQPWRFKVFREDGLKRLGDACANIYKETVDEADYKQEKIDKLVNRTESVSVIVAICMERDPREHIPEVEEIEAVACGVQNMMLHCTAHGLGSFWSSPKICYTDEMRDFLKLGEKDRCLGFFYIGYPQNEWPKSHRKPLEYVCEWVEA